MSNEKVRCPDEGRCYHDCIPGEKCWRVLNCGPLSIAGETWEQVGQNRPLVATVSEEGDGTPTRGAAEGELAEIEAEISKIESDPAQNANEPLERYLLNEYHSLDAERWQLQKRIESDKEKVKIIRMRQNIVARRIHVIMQGEDYDTPAANVRFKRLRELHDRAEMMRWHLAVIDNELTARK